MPPVQLFTLPCTRDHETIILSMRAGVLSAISHGEALTNFATHVTTELNRIMVPATDIFKTLNSSICSDFLIVHGMFHELGIGTRSSDEKAFLIYKEAAEHNDSYGQLFCGVCYRDEIGVKTDTVLALNYLHNSAESG